MGPSESPYPITPPEVEGWEARYIGAEPRLSEVVELYRDLGFEVKVESLDPAECGGCTTCFEASGGEPSKVVYVKVSE